jgi:hypothetical protein
MINRHDRCAAEAKARHATGADRDYEKYREMLRRLIDMPDREAVLAWLSGETVKAAGIDMMMIHRSAKPHRRRPGDLIFSRRRAG